MRGLYGKAGFAIELRAREDVPVCGNLVRLRVLACGVCGTDLHFLRDMPDWTPLGHEISAEVVEIGDAVTRVKVGDRVICEDVTMCGACEACKSGRFDLCRSGITLNDQPGMSDELVVHENMLNVYAGIDPVAASMTEPLAVAVRGVDMLHLRPFESVAIFGMGAIGLFSAAYARSLGAGRIAMFAHRRGSLRNQAAEAAACDLGADEIRYTADADCIEDALRGGGFDAAIVAAPPQLTADALRLLNYGGRALVMGVSFGAPEKVPVDVCDMVFNKKQLLTSIAEPAQGFPLSLELIRSGRIRADRVITHTLPLKSYAELKNLYAQDAPAIKTVMLCE